ncbi:MAG: M10 family metallopeptidase C-terminal domain-containing protein [Hyphomicrobiaceae bacterium]|nr:M10 family metallopeptidase C-terminal domain-containing protein [Hyphomicrobiaceae bacterium]MCC0023741.1 M10 family metallopeptidase C-terminal domain-containing protein [Hyphomicrobiaceae bacterium]
MASYPPKISQQDFINKLIGTDAHWDGTELSFSFNSKSAPGAKLDSTYRGWIKSVLDQMHDLLGFDFVQTRGTGADFLFDGVDGTGNRVLTSDITPNGQLPQFYRAEVQFDTSWTANQSSNLDYGSYGYWLIIHNVLHAFGFDHPGNNDVTASYFADAEQKNDTRKLTVMSFFDVEMDGSGTSHWFKEDGNWVKKYASTPMVFDLLALKKSDFGGHFAGYDFNSDTRKGNDVYGYHVAAKLDDVFDFKVNHAPIVTIYDAGGRDTLDLSGDNVSVRRVVHYNPDHTIAGYTETARTTSLIDLRPGKFSSTHGMDDNIAIAFRTRIENAIGTKFDDWMVGNNWNNRLTGQKGNDLLDGKKGNDVLKGGGGDDRFVFAKNYDHDTIIGFRDDHDVLLLNDNLLKNPMSKSKLLKTFAEQHKDGVVLDFGHGDVLKIKGIEIAQLKDDIYFV